MMLPQFLLTVYESIVTKTFLGPSSMMYCLFSFSIKIEQTAYWE